MRQKRYAVFAKPPSNIRSTRKQKTEHHTTHPHVYPRRLVLASRWNSRRLLNNPMFKLSKHSKVCTNRSIVGEVAAEDVTCRRWGEPKTQMLLCEKPSEWMQNPEIEIILGQSKSWQSCLNPGCVSSWECPCTLATLGNVLRFYFDLQYSIPLAAWNLQEIWGHHAVGWEQNRMESTQSAKRINHSALPSWQCLTMSCMVSSLMKIQNRCDILDRSVTKYVITL